MKLGLGITEFRAADDGGHGWDSVLAQARTADECGFDSVWVPDHFMWDGSTGRAAGTPALEVYQVHARRLRAGTLQTPG